MRWPSRIGRRSLLLASRQTDVVSCARERRRLQALSGLNLIFYSSDGVNELWLSKRACFFLQFRENGLRILCSSLALVRCAAIVCPDRLSETELVRCHVISGIDRYRPSRIIQGFEIKSAVLIAARIKEDIACLESAVSNVVHEEATGISPED